MRRPRGSPASSPSANGWPPAPARTGLTPPRGPQPLPPSPPRSTAQRCPRHDTDAPGVSEKGAPATTHAYEDNRDVGLRWLPPAGRPPPPPVPLPLPRLPGMCGGDPRGARGAEAGGGSGAGRAADSGAADSLRRHRAVDPVPAEETTPAAQAASPAAPPRKGAPGAQGAETAAPASRAAAPTAAPGAPPAQRVAPAQDPGASPGATTAAEESG